VSLRVSLQVASSEELLPARLTTVVLHIKMYGQDVSLHHGPAVFPLEPPDTEATSSPPLAIPCDRLDVPV